MRLSNSANGVSIDDMANLIPTAEVARRLGTSVSNVNRWAANGLLKPAYKAPGRLGPRYFRPEDVDGLVFVRGGLTRKQA